MHLPGANTGIGRIDLQNRCHLCKHSHLLRANHRAADTATRVVRVLSHCNIGIPSAFTPNGDGKNDYLYPLNALKAENLQFKVYNRMGQLVFATSYWTKKWDGRVNGVLQETGLYVWMLTYTHRVQNNPSF